MNIYITIDFFEHLEKAIVKAKYSVFIISPYVTQLAASKIIKLTKDKHLSCRLVTLPPGIEYVSGASNPYSLYDLKRVGFSIRFLPRLHAKIYIIDNKIMFLGSANLTERGLGLCQLPNKEIMKRFLVSLDEVSDIEGEYWHPATSFELSKLSLEKITSKLLNLREEYDRLENKVKMLENEFFQDFMSPYEKFLTSLKKQNKIESFEHIPKGLGRNVFVINKKYKIKILRSDNRIETINYDKYFSYTVCQKSANIILRRQVDAVVLILEEPDKFIWLPTTFMVSKVFLKSHKKRGDVWQFQIKVKDKNTIIRTKGKHKPQEHKIEQYKDRVRFRVSW